MCKHIEHLVFFNGHFFPEIIFAHYVWSHDARTCASCKVGSQFFETCGG